MIRRLVNSPYTWIAAPIIALGLNAFAAYNAFYPIPPRHTDAMVDRLTANLAKDKAIPWKAILEEGWPRSENLPSIFGINLPQFSQGQAAGYMGLQQFYPEAFADVTNAALQKLRETASIPQLRNEPYSFNSTMYYESLEAIALNASHQGDSALAMEILDKAFTTYGNSTTRYFQGPFRLYKLNSLALNLAQSTTTPENLKIIDQRLLGTGEFYENLRPTVAQTAIYLKSGIIENPTRRIDPLPSILSSSLVSYGRRFFEDLFRSNPGTPAISPSLAWRDSATGFYWTQQRYDLESLAEAMADQIAQPQMRLRLPSSYFDGFTKHEQAMLYPLLLNSTEWTTRITMFNHLNATRRDMARAITWCRMFEQQHSRLPDSMDELQAFGFQSPKPITIEELREENTLNATVLARTAGLPYGPVTLEKYVPGSGDVASLLNLPEKYTVSNITAETSGSQITWTASVQPEMVAGNSIDTAYHAFALGAWFHYLQTRADIHVTTATAWNLGTGQPYRIPDEFLRNLWDTWSLERSQPTNSSGEIQRLYSARQATEKENIPPLGATITFQTPATLHRLTVPGIEDQLPTAKDRETFGTGYASNFNVLIFPKTPANP